VHHPENTATMIKQRFANLGDLELPEIKREPISTISRFEEWLFLISNTLSKIEILQLQRLMMETTTKRQVLLKAINKRLEQAYDDTLEDILELLDIRKAEDEEDIKAFVEAENEPTITWEQYKQELES
jgi:hypothetical protein